MYSYSYSFPTLSQISYAQAVSPVLLQLVHTLPRLHKLYIHPLASAWHFYFVLLYG
ncbi:hypothetical protein SERLADRAFT_376807 [Serpula lacrymans var. lacrymans S7.9]|uniref:Uncharacterized protein n=1 Tax=Serpula lacrymans var. lacrymans (strain S7.9) TaxID=578457 RepID=F8NEX5_SERL9|nr:uncharacterized protein SERLADRAFT_376807 [Serpula lacrymans var. lacrymans S7.9]EGO31123.1 hypothetical protein SERLADRAFT_376807 [Serpula lacrymans var. lacrymans S7.9]